MQAANNSGVWSATLHCDKLNVDGRFAFPTQGYQVVIKKKEPQGVNPAILVLEKTVFAPAGTEPSNGVAMLVSFEEQANSQYREVEILPDRIRIEVKQN
jgi:hypothetical protein